MSTNVRIVNKGLSCVGTTVYAGDEEVKGVISIALTKIEVGNAMIANIELILDGIDVEAHPLLTYETLEKSAEALGYAIVSRDEE